ncbi:MAG: ZIP family metal transporter [Pseudomonadota bacterium]
MLGDDGVIYGLNASLLAAGVSTSGIFAAAFFGEWVRKNSAYLSAFAVGLLTVAVLFHLIPEAIEQSTDAVGWVAIGFAAMVLVGIGVQAAVGGRAEGAALTFGYASIIALAAHSLLDGVIYAASFQEEPFTGWLATGGLLFHEFPEGVIAFFLLYQAGLSRAQSIILAWIAAAITTVAGTIGANSLLNMTGGIPLAAMLGGAAGGLIYVLIVHLGPSAAKAPNRRGYPIASIGVVVGIAAVIMNFFAGGH